MAKNNRNKNNNGKKKLNAEAGTIKYTMSAELAKEILRKAPKKTGNHQQYLCDFVNDQFRVLGKCVEVIVG